MMRAVSLSTGLALTMGALGTTSLMAQYPTSPPPAMVLRAPVLPPFRETTLSNGLRVVLVENHRTPRVAFRLAMPGGTAHDPPGKTGTAEMVAALLTQGAGARTADDIAAAIEGAGGILAAAADDDFLSLYGSVLSRQAPLAFDLLGDVVTRPTFSDSELELARGRTLSTVQLNLGSPAYLASKYFRAGLYGAHPYGASATAATVRAITRGDVQAFHVARLRPRGALLVVAGDITMPTLTALLTRSLAGWRGTAPAPTSRPQPPQRRRAEILLVHRPGSVQSNVLIGNLAIGPVDPERLAAELATRVVGGGSDGRLFRLLREQRGWTYGSYAALTRPLGIGRFEANAEVRTDVTDSTVREMLTQLKQLATAQIPRQELDDTRGGMVGSFPLAVESSQGLAELIAIVKLYGLPRDYLHTYRQKMSALTPAQVTAAAARTVTPEQALIVVVGDAVKLHDKLAAIAPVIMRNAEGDLLQPADLQPRAAAARYDLSRLVPRRDSFVVVIQGQPAGYVSVALDSANGGWTLTERTSLMNGAIAQHHTLKADASLAPVSMAQEGSVQGQATGATLAYGAGRVTGRVVLPSPTGPQEKVIDTALPVGTLAAETLQLVLPLFPWADGARFTVTIFNSAKSTPETVTLTVVGSESVTVPAGTFESWKVEQTGLDAPVVFTIAKGTSRLVRISPAGQPVELRLAR